MDIRRHRRQAFTLVEILVVCAILAILLAITIPATINARQKSHQTACMNNLRQIGLGMQMYVQDDGGPPPRLHLLYPQFVSDKRIFVCPLDRWVEHGGFVWQSGKDVYSPHETWPIAVSYIYFDFSYPKNAEEMEKLTKDAYRPGCDNVPAAWCGNATRAGVDT